MVFEFAYGVRASISFPHNQNSSSVPPFQEQRFLTTSLYKIILLHLKLDLPSPQLMNLLPLKNLTASLGPL